MYDNKHDIVIDLTKLLDVSFVPFSWGDYSDPPLEITEWCSFDKTGFQVSQIRIGTQSGTHIDAPAHFIKDGLLLEALGPEQLLGSYFLLCLSGEVSMDQVSKQLKKYQGQKILFIKMQENMAATLSKDVARMILSLPPILMVLSGEVKIKDDQPFSFNRFVAEASKFLVEDLDSQKVKDISDIGEIFVFPINIAGVSGSPCRVIVRYQCKE